MSGTEDLIRRLAESGDTRPLPPPGHRAILWFALAVPYVAVVVLLMGPRADLAQKVLETRYLVEIGATLLTAVTAGYAAFCAVVPGHARAFLAAPLIPLAVWLGSLGQGCIAAWIDSGWAGLALRPDWWCLPAIALVGLGPALAMAVMLRRGAPLFPHIAVGLGGLAAAALGNFGLRLFHPTDASLMVLVWQAGTVALYTALAGTIGPLVHNWRQVQRRA